MKYLLPIIILLGLSIFFPAPSYATHVINQFCVGMYGSFSATNWPGGTIDVACDGDTGTAGCLGSVQTLSPGQSFDFANCTCPPFSDGCLKVGKDLRIEQLANGNRKVVGDFSLPTGCQLESALACGVNGNVVQGSFRIVCEEPKYNLTAIAYLDTNNNCVIDGGSPTIPGVRFRLEGTLNASCITGSDGSCTNPNLPGGPYLQTLFPMPDGYEMSACNDTTRQFTLTSDRTNHFFLHPLASPTPTPTLPPGVTPTVTATPTPPACVVPGAVPNVQITCPTCTP
jgi:hypothetical protein